MFIGRFFFMADSWQLCIMYEVVVSPLWDDMLKNEITKPYFNQILSTIKCQREMGKNIFPSQQDIFNAFQLTPFNEVRVLLLGQDPYHGPNQAHGLSFSVPDSIRIPPSLKNIYKELEADLGIPIPQTGNLTSWASQGVLLLNSILTVEENKPGSHAKIGWHIFTDAVIRAISDHHEHVVFLLWGQFAQRKLHLIDDSKHLVLTTAHPSPLSFYAGFKGCRHFSITNSYLINHKKKPIKWG